MKKRLHKINTDITFDRVRLVGYGDPIVLSFNEAFKMAKNEGHDLILISENGEIPIVRIEEYNKFLFNLDKKEKEQKKKSSQNVTKEIKLSCEIDDNDLNTKSRKALEFLEEGDKVKCVIQFKGRQITMPERGEIVMWKFASIVESQGLPEAAPRLDGNKMVMMLKPKKQ